MKRDKSKIIFLLIICFFLSTTTLNAQDDYKYEIGGMAGTSFYMGDANKSKLYQDAGLSGGIIFRYKKDLRWAVKNTFVVGQVSGNTKKSGNAFPYEQQTSFSRTFYELGSQIEFNFFSFSDQFAYLGTKRFTPYVFTGIGVTLGSGDKNFIGANIPIGLGLKYKWSSRINVGLEFSFRKLFNDSFDVPDRNTKPDLNNPYKIDSSLFKNNDWYSLTMFSVTWDFGTRACPCLNID